MADNKLKKIIIITSLAFNVVFVILLVFALFKFSYHQGWKYFGHRDNGDYYEYHDDDDDDHYGYHDDDDDDHYGYHDDDDDDDDDHYEYHDDDDDDDYEYRNRRQRRKMSQDFARHVFSMPKMKHTFNQLHQIRQELLEVAGEKNYDEAKFRQLFDEFEKLFITNKRIVEEQLLIRMRDLGPEERAFLISSFLHLRKEQANRMLGGESSRKP